MADLRDRVVVVTGASSGLGRAVAFELARRGARLVLAARRGEALEDTARHCRSLGGDALCIETDVTIPDEVENLARSALDQWGRIDIWINNAGVTLFAPLADAPFEEHQRVIETNLYGAMHGARAAVPVFRRQRAGTLINIGSVLSEVGHAYVPSYVISKFGVHGLSEALRVELADEPDIHVCTVFPYSIDTPHFEVAANRVNQKPRALPPMQSPEKVARAIAGVCERPRRVRFVPRSLVLGLALHAVVPRITERVLLDALRRFHLGSPAVPATRGSLYAPATDEAHVHGDAPPRISTPRFLVWVVQRFLRVELAAVARRLRPRLLARA